MYILFIHTREILIHIHELCQVLFNDNILTESPVRTQQETRLCRGNALVLSDSLAGKIKSKKIHILDTNGWKIQVKSRAGVNLYAHNLQNILYFHFYMNVPGNRLGAVNNFLVLETCGEGDTII